jgi:hypothetical protein
VRLSSQSIKESTATLGFGAPSGREDVSALPMPSTRKDASGLPIHSTAPFRINRRPSPATNRANVMVNDPPLMVRIDGSAGFMGVSYQFSRQEYRIHPGAAAHWYHLALHGMQTNERCLQIASPFFPSK